MSWEYFIIDHIDQLISVFQQAVPVVSSISGARRRIMKSIF
jgi:hypothetical protein